MKCQPIVYFSGRHTLSPAAWRMIKSLSRHVAIVGQSDDPETAYALIHDSDVFLVYLYADVCQNLFFLYEIGVAFVLRKPIAVIRETDLKFSEISIAKHLYETRILMETRKRGPFQTCIVFGKTCNLPLTLGDVFVYCYENSMIFRPSPQTKCIALLVDKIFSLSRELSVSKQTSNSAVRITMQNSRSNLRLQGYSFKTDFDLHKGKVSLLPIGKYDNKFQTNSMINEHKLISNRKRPSVDITPDMNKSNHCGIPDDNRQGPVNCPRKTGLNMLTNSSIQLYLSSEKMMRIAWARVVRRLMTSCI
ncbi:uncharacterized protein LOC114520113 [Dendronephthya gigantea]|uniref:uncharacterized protein LOC114520113 n=1 Tax=Dendronephthya gigantea TaxID=151771 RepID=UPI001069D069|nr:uncharacterized protein LOC114520113 [Dendronephthya gigantea]XP_028396127.1 uncharacterized protein LOC114520113 [Dendronephthya gigantea]